MTTTQFPPAYREALKQYSTLEKAARLGLTPEEVAEMDTLAAILDEHETAYAARQAGSADVVCGSSLGAVLD